MIVMTTSPDTLVTALHLKIDDEQVYMLLEPA
jgi:hypothetical protein